MIYSLDPADWLAHACHVVQRDLTPAEWRTYLPERPFRRTCTDLGGIRRQPQSVTSPLSA